MIFKVSKITKYSFNLKNQFLLVLVPNFAYHTHILFLCFFIGTDKYK